MKVIELILDEDNEISGVEAISVVENPAIEEEFIALAQEIKLAEVDKEKRILMGALLVPNKPIYRRNGDEEYYVYFSKDTIVKTSQMYLMNGNQNNSTLEHKLPLNGLSLVESWIVEDEVHDKSRKYDMNVPIGTWMGSVKVNNDEIWNDYVKTGKVKGFSIEGYFADKMPRPKESIEETLSKIEEEEAETLLAMVKAIIKGDKRVKGGKRTYLESYSDYPDAVKNNAQRGIDLNDKENNKCATQVGKIRAQQLAKGEPISIETIKRMYSYLSRAEEYYDENDTSACGTISYLLWGGKAGFRWSASKLKELEELKVGIPHYTADGKLWTGPTHKHNGRLMTGITHTEDSEYLYHKDELAEIGSRGGIKKSPKAPKSDTPNKNPKGEGTAKGDASGKTGAKVSKEDEESLQKKSDEFNERYKEKLGYGVTVGLLKSVFQRGLGAFNTSSSPTVKSASQWAHARVNAFLYLVKNGRPQNAKYITDYDLLPNKHPKSPK